MPRPGPRPYECVRRAWHSDRHLPIRGSLIQEIFRVVNEIHAPPTRKNKEWQDKLPVVVLKAEEIMYSKANSEAEYMDVNTLWERANDAINTIIRLDESTETGVSLQPCIEAALILGCTPRRTTRSQRNSTPSYYLNTADSHNGTLGSQNTVRPFVSDYSKIFTSNIINSTNPCLKKSLSPVFLETNWMNRKSSLPPDSNPNLSVDESLVFCPCTVNPSVYPLYYGPEPRSKDSKIGVEKPFESHHCQEGPVQVDCIQDISACCKDAGNKITKADFGTAFENSPEIGCDLSLRLGPCSTHSSSSINNIRFPREVEGFGSHNSLGSKLRNLDSRLDNKSSNASSGDAAGKKRKGVVNLLYEDTQIRCKAKLPLNHHAGQIRNADPSNANTKDHAFCVNTIPSQLKCSPGRFSVL